MSFQDRSFPTLNAVRAAGAIMVVLTHAAFNTGQINHGWTGAVLSRLDFGVTLFFVLSGFLLSRPYFLTRELGRDWPSTRHFYWKRALRILPIYWVVVVAALTARPRERRRHLAGLGHPPHPHPALPARPAGELAHPDVEPLHGGRVLPRCCRCCATCWCAARCATAARTCPRSSGAPWSWAPSASPGRPWSPRSPGTRGTTPSGCPATCPGSWSACATPRSRPASRRDPREHPIERLARDLPGCWILATAVFAIACTPIAGPRLLLTPTGWEAGAEGGPLHGRRRLLRAAARLRPRARGAGPGPAQRTDPALAG